MSYSLTMLERRLRALESLPSARKPLQIRGGLPRDWTPTVLPPQTDSFKQHKSVTPDATRTVHIPLRKPAHSDIGAAEVIEAHRAQEMPLRTSKPNHIAAAAVSVMPTVLKTQMSTTSLNGLWCSGVAVPVDMRPALQLT
jgi:hypothetical protein